jgi:membrane protease YdiL (CAAX protease family)
MLTTEPLFAKRPPAVQFLILLLLIVSSTLLTFFVGILIAMPFFGTDILDSLAAAGDLTTNKDIAMIKYFQVVSQFGIFIFPSLLFSLLVSQKFLSYLRLGRKPASLSVLLTIFLVFSILPVIHWSAELNEGLHLPGFMSRIEEWMKLSEENALKMTEAFLSTTSITGLMVNIVMIGLLAAVGEELLFRSVLIRLFEDWFNNVHVAVITSALLFSAFHLQFYGFLPRFVLGLLFGYLFVWSGSLWLPILAHFVNNASAVLVYYFVNTGRLQTDAGQFGATDDMLFFTISILLSIGFLTLIFITERKRQSTPINI